MPVTLYNYNAVPGIIIPGHQFSGISKDTLKFQSSYSNQSIDLSLTQRMSLSPAMLSKRVIFLIWIYRCWNALVVRTSYAPDEYWQSQEVAHHHVFGYGVLTWEWLPKAQLRGYTHPLVFILFYKFIALVVRTLDQDLIFKNDFQN